VPKKNELRTPNSQIKAALRQLMLRSREQQYALKRDNRRCRRCDVKASQARGRVVKVQCHHVNGVRWTEIIEYIRGQLLVHPDQLMTLCESCHDEAEQERKEKEKKERERESSKCRVPCEMPCGALEEYRKKSLAGK
jgi:hypothetical protein